jgi:hypothetical protein
LVCIVFFRSLQLLLAKIEIPNMEVLLKQFQSSSAVAYVQALLDGKLAESEVDLLSLDLNTLKITLDFKLLQRVDSACGAALRNETDLRLSQLKRRLIFQQQHTRFWGNLLLGNASVCQSKMTMFEHAIDELTNDTAVLPWDLQDGHFNGLDLQKRWMVAVMKLCVVLVDDGIAGVEESILTSATQTLNAVRAELTTNLTETVVLSNSATIVLGNANAIKKLSFFMRFSWCWVSLVLQSQMSKHSGLIDLSSALCLEREVDHASKTTVFWSFVRSWLSFATAVSQSIAHAESALHGDGSTWQAHLKLTSTDVDTMNSAPYADHAEKTIQQVLASHHSALKGLCNQLEQRSTAMRAAHEICL